MNKKSALIFAVTSCFIVAACAEKAEPPKPKAAVAEIPKPPEAPAAAPASAGQDAKTAGAPMKLADATPAGKGGGGGNKKKCKKVDAACDVIVTVKDCVITLDFNELEVANDRKNEKIEWKLDTAGYSWKGKGVTWKDSGASGPTGQFFDHKVQGKVASWKDRNTDTKSYDYKVEVEDKDKKVCVLDPTVINGVNP